MVRWRTASRCSPASCSPRWPSSRCSRASPPSRSDVFVSGINYVYQFDVTTWGWIHLIIGALALAVGVGILTGQSWALVAGMGLAVISSPLAVHVHAVLPVLGDSC